MASPTTKKNRKHVSTGDNTSSSKGTFLSIPYPRVTGGGRAGCPTHVTRNFSSSYNRPSTSTSPQHHSTTDAAAAALLLCRRRHHFSIRMKNLHR